MSQTLWAVWGSDDYEMNEDSFWLITIYPFPEQAQAHCNMLDKYAEDSTYSKINNKFDPKHKNKYSDYIRYGIKEVDLLSGFDEFQEEHNI